MSTDVEPVPARQPDTDAAVSAATASAAPAEPAAPAEAAEATAVTVLPPGDGEGMPRPVLWATLLFVLVAAFWTVAVPAYRPPDEAAHVDLVLHLAEGNGYPSFDGRYFGEAIGLDSRRHLVDSREAWPRFDADDAPPRSGRPDVDDLGGTAPDADARPTDTGRPDHPYLYNQMPQHPPLYYTVMAGVLRLERSLVPGDDRPSLDREIGVLRLANVALVAPLPALAWATAVRLGAGRRAGIVASLLPLGLPQLVHIAAAVNNDNLLILLGGVLSVLLVGVARGRRSRRTDLAVGAAVGLALLTKAFAVMFLPWVVAAYAVGVWTTRRRRQGAVGLAVAGGVGAVVGAWWWVANWLREGEPAPTTENLTRGVASRPPGFGAEPLEFAWMFTGRLVSRTWAWVGYRSPKFELPPRVVMGLTAAVVAAVAVAAVRASRGSSTATAPDAVAAAGPDPHAAATAAATVRRADVALAWLPAVLLAVFVARRAWGLYGTTGLPAFIQGRYLFAALVPPMAVVAVGAAHVLGRRAVGVTCALVAVLQAWVLADVIRGSWAGRGAAGPIAGLVAWSPWPAAVTIGLPVAALAVAALVVVAADRPERGQRVS